MASLARHPPPGWAMMSLVTLVMVTTPALPSTHWLVTESGKVEAQPDSIFHMRQPHDFVSFIHQEQRFEDMNNLHDKLSEFRFVSILRRITWNLYLLQRPAG